MNKFSAIFLVSLLCINMIASLKLSPIDASMLPSNSIRGQLTSMLIEVQQTDSPKTIQKFLSSIKDMLTKLQKEQAEHQRISTQMMNQCKEENTFRRSELKNARNSLAASNAHRAKCDASLKASQKDLPELEISKVTYEKELARATKQRADENKAYRQRKADYEEAINFLTKFISLVSDKLKSSGFKAYAFLEESEHVLRHASKLGLLTESVPILALIAQTGRGNVATKIVVSSPKAPTVSASASASADVEAFEAPAKQNVYAYTRSEGVAQKLKDALNTLLARIKADHKTNEEVEAAQLKAFITYSNKLKALIATLTKNIARVKQQIKDMRTCIANEDVVISTASAKVSRNQKLLSAAVKMCGNFAQEFADATKNRLEQIQTINEIIVIIEKRFGRIPADLKEFLVSVEAGWKLYVNSTAFKRFVEYKQVHIVDNIHGKRLTHKKNRVF